MEQSNENVMNEYQKKYPEINASEDEKEMTWRRLTNGQSDTSVCRARFFKQSIDT